MRKKEALFFVLIVLGLLLISNTHLGYSFGDSIFKAIGIPPWTDTEYDSGLHISVIVGFLCIIAGYIGAVRFFEVQFPKIRSRIILSCIAFVYLFPIVTENAMILLNYNSTSINSVAFSKNDSQCSYRAENGNANADCKLTLLNYGKKKEVTIRPYLVQSSSNTQFKLEPITVILPPHQRVNIDMSFEGTIVNGTSINGWSTNIGMEIEVDGLRKKFSKE